MRTSAAERAMNHVVLALFSLFALAPVVSIVRTAFSARLGQSGAWHPENLRAAWTIGDFGHTLANSLLVAVVVVACATVLSVLAGYAFGTMRFRGSSLLYHLFLLGLMIPAEAVVIPLYFDLRSLGLVDTLFAIAAPQVAQSVAFGAFWMRSQFRSLPTSLVEAAALDGAGPVRALTRILLPASRSAVATLVLLTFMWTWNEFLVALVMAPSGTLRTAPLGLASFQGQYGAERALLACGALIVATPLVLAYLVGQRHFVRGMLEGAAKE